MPKASAPKAPWGRRMAIAANNRDAGTRKTELGADDVDDALAARACLVERHVEHGAVGLECVELRLGERVGDRPTVRGHVVVHRRDREIGPAQGAIGEAEPLEGLRRRDLVQQVEIDVDERGLARFVADDVALPYTVRITSFPSKRCLLSRGHCTTVSFHRTARNE